MNRFDREQELPARDRRQWQIDLITAGRIRIHAQRRDWRAFARHDPADDRRSTAVCTVHRESHQQTFVAAELTRGSWRRTGIFFGGAPLDRSLRADDDGGADPERGGGGIGNRDRAFVAIDDLAGAIERGDRQFELPWDRFETDSLDFDRAVECLTRLALRND